jgi:hypothetical protein
MALQLTPVDDLYRRGHAKKVAGGLMIGLGLASFIGGAAAAIYGAVGPWGLRETPQQDAFIIGGSIASLAGGLIMIAGIPVSIVGSYQVDKAMRRRGFQLSSIGPTGASFSF